MLANIWNLSWITMNDVKIDLIHIDPLIWRISFLKKKKANYISVTNQRDEFLLQNCWVYFLACSISIANGFSHVYIFINCMHEMISVSKRILSSVFFAVFDRYTEFFFPNQPRNE